MSSLSRKVLVSLLPVYLASVVSAQASGTGTTTRYWDCCKPSCAWPGKTTLASGATPVEMCDISGNMLTDYNAVSGCTSGGTAFMPASQSPWAVSDDLAYGYAAVNIAGGTEESWCCGCYELTFTSGAVSGKKMIVQATNTGSDLASNQFDLAMPGGGVGIYNGCTTQWGAPASGWGAQYGGISSREDCLDFPTELQAGCEWRFDWFGASDNPGVTFKQVTCPAALTAKTGCVRAGEVPAGSDSSSSVDSSPSTSSTSMEPISYAESTTPSVAETTADVSVPTTSSSQTTSLTTTISSETTTYTTVTIYPGQSTTSTKPEVYSAAMLPSAITDAIADISTTPIDSTTLVVYTTGARTTNGEVVTETIALTTTICPITEAEAISSSIVASASIPVIPISEESTLTSLIVPASSVASSSPLPTSTKDNSPELATTTSATSSVLSSLSPASFISSTRNSPNYGSISSSAPEPSLFTARPSQSMVDENVVTIFADCSSTSSEGVEAVVTTTIYQKC